MEYKTIKKVQLNINFFNDVIFHTTFKKISMSEIFVNSSLYLFLKKPTYIISATLFTNNIIKIDESIQNMIS